MATWRKSYLAQPADPSVPEFFFFTKVAESEIAEISEAK